MPILEDPEATIKGLMQHGINTSRLGRDLGVNRGTAKYYLHLLKAAHIVNDAQVYSKDPGARARSEKKVHVGDPGTRTAALRASAGEMRGDPAEAGRIAEAAVCDHTIRLGASYEAAWGGDMFYWRNSRGNEVDAVVNIGGRALPVESKHRARVKESDLRGIRRFADQFGAGMGIVVSGEDMGTADGGIAVIPLWLYLLMGRVPAGSGGGGGAGAPRGAGGPESRAACAAAAL